MRTEVPLSPKQIEELQDRNAWLEERNTYLERDNNVLRDELSKTRGMNGDLHAALLEQGRRHRDTAARLERAAGDAAAAGIAMFFEYRDIHGYKEEAAQGKAILEVVEGARAISDLADYRAEVAK